MSTCVVVLDIDAFYAQVEELKDPSLRSKPLACVQKYLVVTCNYPARAAGITKLMSKEEAVAKCPGLELRSAEDTTDYRKTSQLVIDAMQKWADQFDGVVVEKLGMDEFCLDISCAASDLASDATSDQLSWEGHIFGSAGAEASNVSSEEAAAGRLQCYRPMDLRVISKNDSGLHVDDAAIIAEVGECEARCVAAGSQLTRQLREFVLKSTGLFTSAGVSCNRLLSKLAAGLHKPNAQTVMLSSRAEALMNPLSVAVLPGVGRRLIEQLHHAGIMTVLDVKNSTSERLEEVLTESGEAVPAARATVLRLIELANGRDTRPLRPVRPPGRISVEDSFRKCSSLQAIREILDMLAPSLLARVNDDGREARQLVVSWRASSSRTANNQAANGSKVTSRSIPFPAVAGMTLESSARQIADCAEQVLKRELAGQDLQLTKVNLAATQFCAKGARQLSIMNALASKRPSQALEVVEHDGVVETHSADEPKRSKTSCSMSLPAFFKNNCGDSQKSAQEGKASGRMSNEELQEMMRPCFDLLSDDDTPGESSLPCQPSAAKTSDVEHIEVQSSDEENS